MARTKLTKTNAKTVAAENKAINEPLIRDDFDDAVEAVQTRVSEVCAEPHSAVDPKPVVAKGAELTPEQRKAYGELLDHVQDSLLRPIPAALANTDLGAQLGGYRMMLAMLHDKKVYGFKAFVDMLRVIATTDALDGLRFAQQLMRNATWKAATMIDSVERRDAKQRAAADYHEDRPAPWGLEGQRIGTEGEWGVNPESDSVIHYDAQDVEDALTTLNSALHSVLMLCFDEYSQERFLSDGLSYVDVKEPGPSGLDEWISVYTAGDAIARQRVANERARAAKQAKRVQNASAQLAALAALYG